MIFSWMCHGGEPGNPRMWINIKNYKKLMCKHGFIHTVLE